MAAGKAAFAEGAGVYGVEWGEAPEESEILAELFFVLVDRAWAAFGTLAARAVAVLGEVWRKWIWIVMGMLGAFLLVGEVFLGAGDGVSLDAGGEFGGGKVRRVLSFWF